MGPYARTGEDHHGIKESLCKGDPDLLTAGRRALAGRGNEGLSSDPVWKLNNGFEMAPKQAITQLFPVDVGVVSCSRVSNSGSNRY